MVARVHLKIVKSRVLEGIGNPRWGSAVVVLSSKVCIQCVKNLMTKLVVSYFNDFL